MLKSLLKKLFKRNSFLLNLLISIVGFICVPLIGIQLFMIIRSSNEFDQEVTAHYQDTIKTIAGSFEDQLQSLSAAAVAIKYNDDLMQPLLDDVAGYDLYKTAQDMTRYGSGVPFADSIGIYYPNRDMCLHSHYKYAVEGICEQYFPSDSSGGLALSEFIRNTDSLSLFYTGNYPDAVSSKLFVARSVSYNYSRNREVVVFFIISDQTVLDWCSVFIPFSTGVAIMEDGGSYVMKTADFSDELLSSEEYQAFLASADQITLTPKNNDNLILYKYRDSATGRTYMISMPRDTVQKSITAYTNQTASTLIFTIVLLVLLLSATLYINYKPLLRIVAKYIETDAQNSRLSELEMIDSHFFALDQRINDQENLLATFTVSDLLSGVRVPREAAERYFTPEQYRGFVAAAASVTLTSTQTNEVCRAFGEYMPGKLIITTVPYRPETVFVYCSKEEIRLPELSRALQKAVAQVAEGQNSIHFGSVVTEVTQIQSSYNDALLPEKLAIIPGKESAEDYPYGLIQRFVQHACAREAGKALAALNELEAAITKLKPAAKRFVNQKLLYCYLAGLQKSGISIPETEVDQLIAFPNGTLLFKLLRKSVESLPKPEEMHSTVNLHYMEQKLLAFVDENYLDSGLCLSAAADHLQTSIYTVSRIFKECTGMGFKEYITGKRLRQACLLLRSTTLSVTSIAAECGFENANYFTVVFRTEYGMPPSKYRAEAIAANEENSAKDET